MSNIAKNTPTTISTLTFLRNTLVGNRTITSTLSNLTSSNIQSTSSFRFDPNGTSLKSTQQLNVDWSQFENHCFFMSAEALVNTTFDKIINTYPFDGTKKEIEAFFDELSGYERWIFDNIPKRQGSLQFNNSWISVNDKEGYLFPELSKNSSGIGVLTPENTTFSIETFLELPPIANDVQVICQKINANTNCGFTLYISSSTSTSNANLCFSIVSGSVNSYVDCEIQKGSYNHLVATFDCSNFSTQALLYNNLELKSVGKLNLQFSFFKINDQPFLIGSGTSFIQNGSIIIPQQTLSGSIDDFRFFHSKRSLHEQTLYHQKSITSDDSLKLYFKFNEPPPPLVFDANSDLNAIALDSSGHGLHSIITNFTGSLRLDNKVNMPYESDDLSPILFPAYDGLTTLNSSLLTSASLYDSNNPNLITKMIPEHWILQGQSYEGFQNQFGNINVAYSGDGIPGQGVLGSTHMILSFLYMYAKQFDEMKLFLDHFGMLKNISYDEYETTPNTFLYDVSKESGLDLPSLFNESSIEQYVFGENIDNEVSTKLLSLREVQDQITRRVLVNFPKIIRSKGTKYAVESFLRSFGIDVGNSVRIREFGGSQLKQSLSMMNESKLLTIPMLHLTTESLLQSPSLWSQRIEPGNPIVSNDSINDGLLTSGSWSFECLYKWQKNIKTITTQSICRFYVSSSQVDNALIANFTAISSSNGSTTLNLYVQPHSLRQTYDCISLQINDGNSIFDGESWNISFGFEQLDANLPSGSYFIRAGCLNGELCHQYATATYVQTEYAGSFNTFKSQLGPYYASGTCFCIGQDNVETESSTTSTYYLNSNIFSDDVRERRFNGYVSNIRFWSKFVTLQEFESHVKNTTSIGTTDPVINFDFNTSDVGTFERLRMNITLKQDDLNPTNEKLVLYDQTSNAFNIACSGLENVPFTSHIMQCKQLTPYFDESSNSENIKIRGAKSLDLVTANEWTDWAPVYKSPEFEESIDNLRFSIDFSLVDSLNNDIITIFSTLDKIGDSIGSTEAMFSQGYRYIENLRRIYFEQIKESINFKKFFDFFQWFDVSIGTFIEQLLPYKTNFRGINFLVESHMLERHKIVYHTENNYLSEKNKTYKDDALLIQQIIGEISKY